MSARRRVAWMVAGALGGCGTLAPVESDGGAANLPVSGAGPYRPLGSPSPLLADSAAALDDPVLRVSGEPLAIWFSRREAGRATIGLARLAALDAEPAITTALAADRAWEGGSVSQPALLDLPGGRTLLAYATGSGAIAIALSEGDGWAKADAPALLPAGDEGDALASPALLALDDRHVRLLYLAAGALRSADAEVDDLLARAKAPFSRRPTSVVHAGDAPWLADIGRVTARTVVTAAGRRRHDLFLTGRVEGARVVGFAGSFDGASFVFAAAPMLDARLAETWGPSVAAWRGGSLLVHAAQGTPRSVLKVAAEP